MKLYNALSQELEVFEPLSETVTIYVCGVTPYDTTHLGHAFTYASFDVLIRYLEHQGYPINYVQNVTDIDDDILRKGKEVGEDWQALGNRWTSYFLQDMKTLNIRPPEHYPGATQVVPEIISTVKKLIDLGVAYESGGSVYFHVKDYEPFGKLSRIPKGEQLAVANERGNFPDDPKKRDPLDFVLWQAAAPGEPTWDSPWGKGRPGWHIECSTMSSKFLGDTIDIHGGGSDLIFPHHECEIAQAEPILNQDNSGNHIPFTRFWMHTAMVHHEGEKMSKSLGNLVWAKELLKTWSPDALRLYLGSYHYREIWGYEETRLKQSAKLAVKLRNAVTAPGGSGSIIDIDAIKIAFEDALANDLDTPQAIQVLEQLADKILNAGGHDVSKAQDTLRSFCKIFGLRLDSDTPETRVVSGWDQYLARFA